jgi:HPt (histidine-containing phosphotransfer) domain-containing protein
VIEALHGFLKPKQLESLLTESLADTGPPITRRGTCLDKEDGANAAKEAHDLMSVAGICGARTLSSPARSIESSCKQEAMADAIQAFAEMAHVAANAISALTILRDSLIPE